MIEAQNPERSTGFYAPEFDGLRCLAVATVMIAHFSPTLGRYGDWGNIGVRLFFVLSGFLITTILLRNRREIDTDTVSQTSALKRFFARRILRLWPLYFFCLFAAYAFHVSGTQTSLWWHAFFATNHYIYAQRDWPTLLSHFWTLAVEQQFYTVWPVVIFLIPARAIPATLIGLSFAGPFARGALLLFGAPSEFVGVLLPSCLDFLGLGGAIAWIREQPPEIRQKFRSLATPWIPALLIGWIGLGIALKSARLQPRGWPVYDGFLQALGFAGLLWFLLECPGSRLGRILRAQPLVYVGQISYGVYIYHNFMHRLGPTILRRITGQNYFGSESAHVIYLSALSVGVASLSFHFFENPMRKWGRAWI